METIYDTLGDYKINYPESWHRFKSKMPNAIESDFIKHEIERYEKYLLNTQIVRRTDGSIYSVESVHRDKFQEKSILDQFYDPLGNYFKEEVCNNLNFGFQRILEYLESKLKPTRKLSNHSFALLVNVQQELKLMPRFSSGRRDKELQELCEREGYKYGSVRNLYSKINSAGLRKESEEFSDKHLSDIEPYFKDIPKALDFIDNLKKN